MMRMYKRNVGMAFLAMSMLIGMAFVGMMVIPTAEAAPGDWDDPILDEGIMTMVDAAPDFAFNTSSQMINISWDWPAMWAFAIQESNLTITLKNARLGDQVIYHWNMTVDGLPFPEYYMWDLPDSLEPGADYFINVSGLVYNNDDSMFYYDSEQAAFEVLGGYDMIKDIMATPMSVDNSGTGVVNITYMFNRNYADLDTGMFQVSVYNAATMQSNGLELHEPAMENITEGDNNSTAFYHLMIPDMTPVGTYNIFFHAFDEWGYEEIWNETLFSIFWKEMPPEMDNGTVFMEEDGFMVVDLDDHFMDVNGQELKYFINLSMVENLTIVWVDEDTINITAPMDWNGEQTFALNVTDGIANLTFTMTVKVMAMPDNLKVSPDNKIMINEADMRTVFDPQGFFYDPDEPVDDLTVSLGWEWAVNETNVSYMKSIWSWTDGNFSVEINESMNTDGLAMMIADLEEGSAEFPIAGWLNGTWVLNATAMVEITPVNDIPAPSSETLELYRNEAKTFNLSALFVDPDSTDLNFTINKTMAHNVEITYNWETFMLTIDPALNWTGETEFNVTATDGTDEMEYTMIVKVMFRTHVVSGKVMFVSDPAMAINFSNVTLTIGTMEIELNETGAYSVELDEGEYDVSLDIPEDMEYSEADMRSGFVIPELEMLVLSEDTTYDITLNYMVYEEPMGDAVWADIDFSDVIIEDGDEWTIIVKVKEDAENKTGWDTFVLKLVIVESDDENFTFVMNWSSETKTFTRTLDKDDLKDLGEGKKKYYFTNEDGSLMSEEKEYKFKSEDSNAGPMTIIILVALILLVLIALIFIMKKPSEDDFDEGDEEEDEGRTCPGCGETVTDDEADECPYCGEDLEEE